jgi:hypothetical protein
MVVKIISGGQTGVDRAALDAAMELGLPCGGWCPRGRKAENGVVPERYPLTETATEIYAERTEKNVLDSDATLVLVRGQAKGGSKLTIELAGRHKKPCLEVDVSGDEAASFIRIWLGNHSIQTLNVAGPRESTAPGIHAQALALIRRVLMLESVDPPGAP